MQRKYHQQGQILLITIMLLAAAVTVVMTIAFNSTTETQITKLEEDSQKALSAAEAALEAAIQRKGQVLLSELDAFDNTGITGKADVIEMGGNEFVTPLLQRDEQYTFYLSDYNTLITPPTTYWTGDLQIYLKSESPADCPALELTIIDKNNVLTKYIVDPCSPAVFTGGVKVTTAAGPDIIKGISFAYRTTPASFPATDMKLAVIRVLNTSTRLGFTGLNLKAQGRLISSEAKTQGGATKKIELFQSYPQIPADFFVTGF